MTTPEDRWSRFRRHHVAVPGLGFALDPSLMELTEADLARFDAPMAQALDEMAALEAGAIANPDEQRMVGHYWLRAPERAPTPALRAGIEGAIAEVDAVARRVHAQGRFEELVVCGIGGSALGPMLAARALGGPGDRLRTWFCDNTDPDGIDDLVARLAGRLDRTLVVVISKSGGTPETRNGMRELAAAFARAGLDFAGHAIAVTGTSGALFEASRGWLARLPMWDFVGGRTSQTSAVGLLPMALAGWDVRGFLGGAAAMDEATRLREWRQNPAAVLAACWHHAGGGTGARAMVVLPYRDRLELFPRYLQQLVMESLGKRLDRKGRVVHQGLTVYGNKGSTDQHAYVQQLRDGRDDFFVTFVATRRDRKGPSIEVEPGVTSGDFLHGFWMGTRAALSASGRGSITLWLEDVDARSLGALIALYERAVGLYASLIDVNAYHQPGVEAGKLAAAEVLSLERRIAAHLAAHVAESFSAEALAGALRASPEDVWHLCERLWATGRARREGVEWLARYAAP